MHEAHHRFLQQIGIVGGHGREYLPDEHPLRHRQRAHHAQIDPHHVSVAHEDVARMRVGVEESVVEHLGHIALAHAARERVHVDALLAQLFGVGDFGALDELHDEHRLAGILRVGHR